MHFIEDIEEFGSDQAWGKSVGGYDLKILKAYLY